MRFAFSAALGTYLCNFTISLACCFDCCSFKAMTCCRNYMRFAFSTAHWTYLCNLTISLACCLNCYVLIIMTCCIDSCYYAFFATNLTFAYDFTINKACSRNFSDGFKLMTICKNALLKLSVTAYCTNIFNHSVLCACCRGSYSNIIVTCCRKDFLNGFLTANVANVLNFTLLCACRSSCKSIVSVTCCRNKFLRNYLTANFALSNRSARLCTCRFLNVYLVLMIANVLILILSLSLNLNFLYRSSRCVYRNKAILLLSYSCRSNICFNSRSDICFNNRIVSRLNCRYFCILSYCCGCRSGNSLTVFLRAVNHFTNESSNIIIRKIWFGIILFSIRPHFQRTSRIVIKLIAKRCCFSEENEHQYYDNVDYCNCCMAKKPYIVGISVCDFVVPSFGCNKHKSRRSYSRKKRCYYVVSQEVKHKNVPADYRRCKSNDCHYCFLHGTSHKIWPPYKKFFHD